MESAQSFLQLLPLNKLNQVGIIVVVAIIASVPVIASLLLRNAQIRQARETSEIVNQAMSTVESNTGRLLDVANNNLQMISTRIDRLIEVMRR